MDMEAQIAAAVRAELRRQSEEATELSVADGPRGLVLNGPVDLEALAMAIAGAVAGGP
jgi:hypothetical protein